MCALSPCRYGIAAEGPESTRKQEGLATLWVMGVASKEDTCCVPKYLWAPWWGSTRPCRCLH